MPPPLSAPPRRSAPCLLPRVAALLVLLLAAGGSAGPARATPEAPAGLSPAEARLLQDLGAPSAKRRALAARAVGRHKGGSLADALLGRLADGDAAVQAAAAASLGQLGEQRSRPGLAALLAHSSAAVARAASQALGALDRKRGKPRYLVAIAPPILPKGVDPARGELVVSGLRQALEENPEILCSAGEDKALEGGRLLQHLRGRKLEGLLLMPALTELSGGEAGARLTGKVSVVCSPLVSQKIDFAVSTEASIAAGRSPLAPAARQRMEGRVIGGAARAAAEEVIDSLRRRAARR